MTVWVNQIAILVNVETYKCHGNAILVEEYVRMRAVEKQSLSKKYQRINSYYLEYNIRPSPHFHDHAYRQKSQSYYQLSTHF